MSIHHQRTDITTLCGVDLLPPRRECNAQLFFTGHGFGTKDTLPINRLTLYEKSILVTNHSEVTTCLHCKRVLRDMAKMG